MGRPARETKRVSVLMRFEPDELALIDQARGSIARTDWILLACRSELAGNGLTVAPAKVAAPVEQARAFVAKQPPKAAAQSPLRNTVGWDLDGTPLHAAKPYQKAR